jgi:hypothetical protein
MKQIEKTLRQYRAIRLLFIFEFFLFLPLIVIFFWVDLAPVLCGIFLPLIALCGLVQLWLTFKPVGTVVFHVQGLTVQTKKLCAEIAWKDVLNVYFRDGSDWFLLAHFLLDLRVRCDGKTVDFSGEQGEVKLSQREYLEIISLIPKEVLAENEYMIYRNITEKDKNEYRV